MAEQGVLGSTPALQPSKEYTSAYLLLCGLNTVLTSIFFLVY